MAKLNDEFIKINIHIIPNSSKNEIVSLDNNMLKIKLQAPPIDGKANKACIEFLSKAIKVPKTSIEIVKGTTSKFKTIIINNITMEYFTSKVNVKNS